MFVERARHQRTRAGPLDGRPRDRVFVRSPRLRPGANVNMSRCRSLILAALLVGGMDRDAHTQQVRRIPLDLARGEIDRIFLPVADTFYFVIRAASELRELRASYGVDS